MMTSTTISSISVKPRLRREGVFIGNRIVEFYRSDAGGGEAFHHNRRMFARLSAFVIWSLVAATAVFWALRLGARPPQAPAYAVRGRSTRSPVRGDLARLFGAPPGRRGAGGTAGGVPRVSLLGVMAPQVARSRTSRRATASR